jgi:hypothetical protein
MSLAEKVANKPTAQRQRCRIAEIRDSLPEDEQQALDHMLATWGAYETGCALREEGHRHDANALLRHRQGKCACYAASMVEPA